MNITVTIKRNGEVLFIETFGKEYYPILVYSGFFEYLLYKTDNLSDFINRSLELLRHLERNKMLYSLLFGETNSKWFIEKVTKVCKDLSVLSDTIQVSTHLSDKMMNLSKASPSRKYILPIYDTNFPNYSKIKFVSFTIPEQIPSEDVFESEEGLKKILDNTTSFATWWFYNRIDSMSAGFDAIPIELVRDEIIKRAEQVQSRNEKREMYLRMKDMLFPSTNCKEGNYAVETSNSYFGFGIYSYHVSRYEAEFNANLIQQVDKYAKVIMKDEFQGEL